MPNTENQSQEVVIALVACMLVFIGLAVVILLFLYLYQRRRYMQQQEMTVMRQQFTEQSLQAQLEIQEQTFKAISEEIHDNVGQLLSLARVQINIIDESGRLDKTVLHAARENVGKALMELRDLSKGLHPERLQHLSIHETLLQETERLNRAGNLKASIIAEGVFRELESKKRLILFRVLQECTQNCLKHAEATELLITFNYREKDVAVSVRDNGKGFDEAQVIARREGQGLDNIRNRVRLTGGKCEIVSAPMSGTEISLTIPYE